MKKLLCTILMTALIVCMMPTMAFADTLSWEANGKVQLTLASGEGDNGTTATVTAYDDYSVVAEVNGTKVNASGVSATLKMKNVAGLGVTDERTHTVSVTTPITNHEGIDIKERWLNNVYNFKGCTVIGKVNDQEFTYEVIAMSNSSGDNYTCTATPMVGVVENPDEVRAAWQTLVAMVSTDTKASDDSQVYIPAYTYLRVGNEKLIFDNKCAVNPSADGAALVGKIQAAAHLETVVAADNGIEVYFPSSSCLQVGSSAATLNKGITVRTNVVLAGYTLSRLRSVVNEGNLFTGIAFLVTEFNTAVGKIDAMDNIYVNILSDCNVTLKAEGQDDIEKTVVFGDTLSLADPQAPAGQRFVGWYNGDTKVEANSVVTSDMTLTARFETISTPGGIPSIPTAPTDNITNSGTSGTDNATTSANLSGSTSTSNGTTSATVDKTTADKIVDKVVENKSTEVVIDATANTTTAANSTTIAQVTIPTETLGAIAEKTEADVTIKTDVAEVKMDNAAAAAVSEQAEGDTVQIIAEKVAEEADKVELELKVVCSDGKVISNFNGGNIAVTVALPKAMADKKVVCVYIDDNGHMSKVEGQKNADGTYTFVTGHFSSYAILAEEEADAAIAAQKEAIKNIKIKLTSKQVKTKAGKKAVKITWTAAAGDKVLDGVEVFRSTERYKGYGTEPFYTSTKGGNTGSYTNTKSLKKGTKYYYRVRGYVLVDGQKVYTDYSTKAWRTVK